MNRLLFVCIGSSKIIGDSVGPLVGTIIDRSKNCLKEIYDFDCTVLGTFKECIGYSRLNEIKEFINLNSNKFSYIIVIDSALGRLCDIGKIIVSNSMFSAGNGINDGFEMTGDYVLKVIVGENHNSTDKNIKELNNVNILQINEMAFKVLKIISEILIKREEIKMNKK